MNDNIDGDLFEGISNSTSLFHLLNGTTKIKDQGVELNFSEYIVPPEKEGSPYGDCASIVLKSDLKVLFDWKWFLQGIFSSIIIAVGCIGNVMATIILCRPKLRSAFNQLLISLCIFDSIFLVSNILTAREAFGFKDSDTLSSYTHVVAHISMCASVFMMVALTLERHFAICSPHAYRIHLRITPRWKHLSMYIVPVTFLAFFVNIPLFINLQRTWMEDALYVKINLYLRALHPLTTTGLAPVIILVALNIRICRGIAVLNKKRQTIHGSGDMSRGHLNENEACQPHHDRQRNKRHHKEISATYTAIAIVSSFVILHLPRIAASTHEVLNTKLIITCIEAGRQYIPPIDFYKTDFIARMLLVINSAINFLIYCAVSSQFQKALFDVFCPCVPPHRRPGRSHRSRRSAIARRSLNPFRGPDCLCDRTTEFEAEGLGPCVDPSMEATIVVNAVAIESQFGSGLLVAQSQEDCDEDDEDADSDEPQTVSIPLQNTNKGIESIESFETDLPPTTEDCDSNNLKDLQ